MSDEEYLKKLGARIKKIRLEKDITQVDLANACDFEKSNMSRIEAGRANATIITLIKISTALGISVSELVKDIDSTKKE